MKKIIIFSFILSALLISCNEPDFVDNAQQVGISKVTYYPTITIQGDTYMAVASGGTFTDPGATAEAGGASVPVVVSGSVNTSTAGVYVVTYTATNKDGFSASGTRWVAVYSTDAGAAAHDFSGNYARTSNGSIATWTKLAPGVYTVFNPGGAPGTNITLIAFNPTGFTINVPAQVSNDGSVFRCTNSAGGADIVYNPTGGTGLGQYAWKVVNPGYGTSLRTFNKL